MIWAFGYFIIAVIFFLCLIYYTAVNDARDNKKEGDDGIGLTTAAAIFWVFSLFLFCLYWIIQGGPVKLYKYIWAREKKKQETEEELRRRIRELEMELKI